MMTIRASWYALKVSVCESYGWHSSVSMCASYGVDELNTSKVLLSCR